MIDNPKAVASTCKRRAGCREESAPIDNSYLPFSQAEGIPTTLPITQATIAPMVKVLTSVTSVLALVFMLGLTGCSDVMGPDLDPAANEITIETQDASAITADNSDNGSGSTQRGGSHNEVDGMD